VTSKDKCKCGHFWHHHTRSAYNLMVYCWQCDTMCDKEPAQEVRP
jgi:hypothetical protein